MPYGYLGQTTPNQLAKNSGVLSMSDVHNLTKQGKLGGSLELIDEKIASSDSTIDFLSIKQDVYDVHLLQVNNYQANTDNTILGIRLYESGVLETASVYQVAMMGQRSDPTGNNEYKSTTSNMGVANIGSGIDNAPAASANGYCYLYNLGDVTKFSFSSFHWVYVYYTVTELAEMNWGGGVLPQASIVDGFRIFANAGTFSGNFKLYGVKEI